MYKNIPTSGNYDIVAGSFIYTHRLIMGEITHQLFGTKNSIEHMRVILDCIQHYKNHGSIFNSSKIKTKENL